MYVSIFSFPICQTLITPIQSCFPHYFLPVMIKYFSKLCFILTYGELSLLYRSHQYLYRPVNSERSGQMVSYYEMLMKVFLPKAVCVLNIVLNTLFTSYFNKKMFLFFFTSALTNSYIQVKFICISNHASYNRFIFSQLALQCT